MHQIFAVHWPFPPYAGKRNETKQQLKRSENARLVLVGFSTTRYESFPAGLHGIRTDKDTNTLTERDRNG